MEENRQGNLACARLERGGCWSLLADKVFLQRLRDVV